MVYDDIRDKDMTGQMRCKNANRYQEGNIDMRNKSHLRQLPNSAGTYQSVKTSA